VSRTSLLTHCYQTKQKDDTVIRDNKDTPISDCNTVHGLSSVCDDYNVPDRLQIQMWTISIPELEPTVYHGVVFMVEMVGWIMKLVRSFFFTNVAQYHVTL
jgi:hypothetical protein